MPSAERSALKRRGSAYRLTNDTTIYTETHTKPQGMKPEPKMQGLTEIRIHLIKKMKNNMDNQLQL